MGTNLNDVEQVNLSKMAGGKNGSLEMQKYLYETGLQNIFNDYNKQIANLDASKQKDIEDAYYVRELSKKYLGEYASNIGIGDVSGQLLDIYGKYQSNLNEINANFTELQTGLESSYNDKKNEYELGLLQTQIDIEQEQLAKEINEIRYNIEMGFIPEGMDTETHLDSVRDKIGEESYWNYKIKNDLIEMNSTVEQEMATTNEYAKEEWDAHVDDLFNNKKINADQVEYMKSMYEVEQNTNFILDNSINNDSDIAYFSSDEDIVSKGNVYVSRNKDRVLAETKNVIDSSNEYFERINKDYQKYDKEGNFIGDMGVGVPFGSGNKMYVSTIKDNEQVFVEYKFTTNYNKLTNNETISKSNKSQKEMYYKIDKTLNGKSGMIDTGSENTAFTYNEKDGSYTKYLNYTAGESGDFLIGENVYSIGEQIEDLKDNWDFGDNPKWEKGYNDDNVKSIVSEFVKMYFDGNSKKFGKYLESTRGFLWKNKVSSSNDSKVKPIVVRHNNKYYTINDGELWELSKK